jgi:hypothetical protein
MSYDLDKFAEITAFRLGMEEEPVILWPLCGYEEGWCMSPEGCIIEQTAHRAYNLVRYRIGNTDKCKYRTMLHPEYDIKFEELI